MTPKNEHLLFFLSRWFYDLTLKLVKIDSKILWSKSVKQTNVNSILKFFFLISRSFSPYGLPSMCYVLAQTLQRQKTLFYLQRRSLQFARKSKNGIGNISNCRCNRNFVNFLKTIRTKNFEVMLFKSGLWDHVQRLNLLATLKQIIFYLSFKVC